MNKSLAITLSATALIVVIAICVLVVLSALTGQDAGLEHAHPCATTVC
jgi:hypothetical protein